MKFNDLFENEKYIQVAYLECRDRQQAYFQIQFIEVIQFIELKKQKPSCNLLKILEVNMAEDTLTALPRGNECNIQT